MPKIIKGLIPPGGFHYFQSDVKLESWSEAELVRVVSEYRANNGLPVGDVQGDIERQLCGRSPHACHQVDSVEINFTSNARPTRQGELLNDIVTWASNLLSANEPVRFVHDSEAERRALVCRACPNNANWRGGCAPCIANADRLCATLRQTKDTANSKVLGGCDALRHDNRTAIFLDKDCLAKSHNIPQNCWLND